MIRDIFENVKSTASANERKKLIQQALESDQRETILQIFEDCYGPTKYNITSDSVNKALDDPKLQSQILAMVRSAKDAEHYGFDSSTIDSNYEYVHETLTKLADRTYSGNEAIMHLASLLIQFRDDAHIIRSIVDKNLKIGFSLEQVNKLLGKKKKEFEVSLAYNLDDVKGVDPIDGTYFASRKLDGCRCVCFVETGWDEDEKNVHIVSDPIFKSRQNKEFTTLNNLIEPMRHLALEYHIVGKLVFDGEVCILDEKGDEHFDWIMKEIRRKNHTIANPCYNIFDVVTQEQFEGLEESPNFTERDFSLTVAFKKLLDKSSIKLDASEVRPIDRLHLLKQELIRSQEDFDRWSGYVSKGGWEGFMLRKDAPYKSGRTKDLLKVKKFKDAEYKVVGYEGGMMKYGTTEVPVVTNILIEHKGNVVSVGSGISKEQRIAWYDEPANIVGKTVTIQYFEETVDSKTGKLSLRFPVLKYVYDEERDV